MIFTISIPSKIWTFFIIINVATWSKYFVIITRHVLHTCLWHNLKIQRLRYMYFRNVVLVCRFLLVWRKNSLIRHECGFNNQRCICVHMTLRRHHSRCCTILSTFYFALCSIAYIIYTLARVGISVSYIIIFVQIYNSL